MRGPRLNRADWLLLGVMLVMAAVASLIAYATTPADRAGSGIMEIPSSFYDDRAGAMALMHTWDRLGFDVQRVRKPPAAQTLEGFSGLVLLRPLIPIDEAQADELLDWVADGGALL